MISPSSSPVQASINSSCSDDLVARNTDGANSGVQVAFAIMPYHKLSTPALGASILQQCLIDYNISSKIFYCGFSFAKHIGLSLYNRITQSSATHLIGEWTFSAAAFDSSSLSAPEAFQFFKPDYESVYRCAPLWIHQCALDLLKSHPRIVVCSSLFQQNLASLALLKKIKELDPSVKTIMGGPNTEGILGIALLRRAPWLDFVCSGDGEEVLPQLCAQLLTSSSSTTYPLGVTSQSSISDYTSSPADANFPRATLSDINKSPIPRYDDFFETLNSYTNDFKITPALLVESARGCWWGQRSQCTFCGLNGDMMRYRAKDPDSFGDKLLHVAERFSVSQLQFVDNIIDKKYFTSFLPKFTGKNYELFYETKADITEQEFKAFADSGTHFIQPGIESLSTNVLQLMKKGTSLPINLRCLRLCKEYGISPSWTILCKFPSEQEAWYKDVCELLPSLFHLPPPSTIIPIRFDRFSPYFDQRHDLGLNLDPYSSYDFVYPKYNFSNADVAYFFKPSGQPDKEAHPWQGSLTGYYKQCLNLVQRWTELWMPRNLHPSKITPASVPFLYLDSDESCTPLIHDGRTNPSRPDSIEVTKSLISLLSCCRNGASASKIFSLVNSDNPPFSAQDIKQALSKVWLVKDNNIYISIVQDRNTPAVSLHHFPGGSVQTVSC
ncbi:MAG: hypothetical protein CL862_14455 [Cyanobium sp. NAT70]|nr:hypothetical protein [Cyanobium sp. NAT70]